MIEADGALMEALTIRTADARTLRDVYKARRERIERLRADHAEELNARGLRLLDRVGFGAYLAAREAGR